MRPFSPSPRQVYFSAALTAAAALLLAPQVHWRPATGPAVLDAAVAVPRGGAVLPVLPAPPPGTASRLPASPAASPSRSRPRVSDDLEAARVIPPPKPSPSQVPSQAPVQAAAPAPQPSRTAAAAPYPSYTPLPAQSAAYSGSSAFQACVIARESGGNPQVMNASGHYGLYQFDYGTWVSGGGSPADFGHASVAEQNQVFASVYAARGTSPWGPYDGCS